MANPSRMKPTLEEQIEIAATPERVWSILADPAAMVRHSPMVVAAYVRSRPVGIGTRVTQRRETPTGVSELSAKFGESIKREAEGRAA